MSILRIAGLWPGWSPRKRTGKQPCVVLGPSPRPSAHQGRPPALGGPPSVPAVSAALPLARVPSGHGRDSGGRDVPEARRLDTGDVVLPVEVGLHVARAAMVPVQRLHGLVDAPAVDGRRQHPHRPLALL